MNSLKITFYLQSPIILNRLTTIDSTLLRAYFKKKRNVANLIGEPLKPEKIGFLSHKYGTVSGSIWFVDKDAPVDIGGIGMHKKPDYKMYWKEGVMTAKGIDSAQKSGQYKLYKLAYETLLTDSIYFYVNGDEQIIEDLCNVIWESGYIGKKTTLGYGRIKDIKLKKINEDKSFFLNEFTPSRPIPVKENDVKCSRIAYYRVSPPYWLKWDLTPCYMPHTALYELIDEKPSMPSKTDNMSYITPSSFVRQSFADNPMIFEKPQKAKPFSNEIHRCSFCGRMIKKGFFYKDVKDITSDKFTDHNIIDEPRNGYICEDCLWGLKAKTVLEKGKKKGKEVRILVSGSIFTCSKEQMKLQKSTDRIKIIKDIIDGVTPPPFFLNLSVNGKKHVLFKSKISISNELFTVAKNGLTLYVDASLLKEAIKDMILAYAKYKKKANILIMRDAVNFNAELKSLREKFVKKYDYAVREILSGLKKEDLKKVFVEEV